MKFLFLILFTLSANAQTPWRDNAGVAPVGTMQAFAQSTCPTGWLPMDGSAISRTTYSKLFAALGTAYGVGNGSTTFNVPNYRCTTDASCTMEFTAFMSSAGTASQQNVTWITGSCGGGPNYACPTNVFTVTPICDGSYSSAGVIPTNRAIGINTAATTASSIQFNFHQGGTGNVSSDGFLKCSKTGADYKATVYRNGCIRY